MPTEKKQEIINQFEKRFSECTIVIVTHYQGLSASNMDDLRRRLRQCGNEYYVAKNTLVSMAADKVGWGNMKELLGGPVGVALGFGEVTEIAKVIADYIKTSSALLNIKGGLMEGKILSSDQVVALAKLPSKEILVSMLLRTMQGPISSLVYVLSANLKQFVLVLEARRQQLEGA